MKINQFSISLALYSEANYLELSQSDIEARATLAATEAENSIKNGEHLDVALEKANQILYTGLLFSPIGFIKNIAEVEFHIAEDEIILFSKQMYEITKGIFDKYDIHDDSFMGSNEEELLYSEIVGEIQIYLSKNGLQ